MERVSDAIWEALGSDIRHEMSADGPDVRDVARAAIAAMREPNQGMTDAVTAFYRALIADDHERDQHMFLNLKAHRLAIDAALKPDAS